MNSSDACTVALKLLLATQALKLATYCTKQPCASQNT